MSSSRRRRASMKTSREARARRRVHMSTLFRPTEAGDQACELVPRLDLARQLAFTGYGNRIELGLAIGVGRAPARRDPSLVLEPHEGGVDGAFVQFQNVMTHLLDAPGDP